MKRKKRYAAVFGMILCLAGVTGCERGYAGDAESKENRKADTLAETDAAEEKTEADITESAEEKAEADITESAEEKAEADMAEPTADAAAETGAMQTQSYEEMLCDKEDGTELVTISWVLPRLTGDVCPAQEKINAALQEDMEQTRRKIGQEWADEEEMYMDCYVYAMAKSAYEQQKADAEACGSEIRFMPYYYGRGYELMRADEKVVSLKSVTYSYYGGAHGSQIVKGENYDAESGERLTLSDIWTDEALFKETCVQEILKLAGQMTEKEGDIFFENYEESVPDLIADGLWYFSKDGLVLISQEYMLQPYAAGTIEFEIAYEKLTECLKIN